MSESRICPVCENEIPEDARFLCPSCQVNLQLLDDEEVVARARNQVIDVEGMEAGQEETYPLYKNNWMRFPKIAGFYLFWIVLNASFAALWTLYFEGGRGTTQELDWNLAEGLFFIIVISQGIFYSLWFSRSKWQLFLFPIIWSLLIAILGVLNLVLILSDGSAYGAYPIIWGVLSFGFWLLFFRNIKGCWPSLTMLLSMILIVDIVGDGWGWYRDNITVENIILASLAHAVISGIPFIFLMIIGKK